LTPQILFEKASYLLFFITLILFPIQLGKHFWPPFSFVLGLKIDYLSPTIFLSDVFILLFILVSFINYFFYKKKMGLEKFILFPLLLFLFSVVLSTIVNGGKAIFLFKTLKIFEFALLALFISFLDFKKIFYRTIIFLSSGIIWTSVLGLLQFAQQQSLGLWFLGERHFNITTPGISQLVYKNQLILRPYSTFPHPNLFAAYLALFLPWVLFFLFRAKTIANFAFLLLSLFFGFAAIFLMLVFFLWQKRRNFLGSFPLRAFFVAMALFALVSLLFFIGPLILDRFLTIGTSDSHSLILRAKFAKAAIAMFFSAPIFGLGPGSFIPQLPYFWQLQETIRVLQPAHNLILLVLAELGILGALSAVLLMVLTFVWLFCSRLKERATAKLLEFSILSVFFLSLFDHYFWTLQQGLFIFWLVLGLSWSFCYKRRGA
jgi:O-antigen ligase